MDCKIFCRQGLLVFDEKGFALEPCRQEEAIREIRNAVTDMVIELRKVMQEMRETMVEDREHKTRIQHLEKGQDVLFKKTREHTEELRDLTSWQDRMDGSIKVVVAIPVLCTVVSTLAALWATFGGP